MYNLENFELAPESKEKLRKIVAAHQVNGFKEDLTVFELDLEVYKKGNCTIKQAISVSLPIEWAIELLDKDNPKEQSNRAKGPIVSLAKAVKSKYGKIFTAVMGGAALASGCSTDIDHSANGKVKSIDNDNFRTSTQGLTALDLDHLSTPTKLPWSAPGDVGVELFKADGYIHFTFAKAIDDRDYKISCQNLEDCLSATSGVKRVVGSAERTGGSEGMAHNPVTGELLRVGNDWDWEPAQKSIPTYNASTDDLILTNSTDSCEIGGSPQIMNDGITVYSSYSRGPVDKDILSTCDNETKPTLNGLGAPAQDPENDNLFLVGQRNQATGFVYLAYATSLADLEAGLTTLVPNLVRGTLNINPTIRVIDGKKIIAWEGEDGLYYATVEDYCGDGICTEDSTTCPADCPVEPPVCGDGNVEGTELCDDENCNANCDDCNPGYELSGTLCVAQTPDTDLDAETFDTSDGDDFFETTDTSDGDDSFETTDTSDGDDFFETTDTSDGADYFDTSDTDADGSETQQDCFDKVSTVLEEISGNCEPVSCNEEISTGEFNLSVKGDVSDKCVYSIKKAGYPDRFTLTLSSETEEVKGTINLGELTSDGAVDISTITGTNVEARITEDGHKATIRVPVEGFPGEVETGSEGSDFSTMAFIRDGHFIIRVTSYESEVRTVYHGLEASLDIGTTEDGSNKVEGNTEEYDVTYILNSEIPELPDFGDLSESQPEQNDVGEISERKDTKGEDCGCNINNEPRRDFRLAAKAALALFMAGILIPLRRKNRK